METRSRSHQTLAVLNKLLYVSLENKTKLRKGTKAMRVPKIIILLMITFMALLWAFSAASQMATTTKLESFYGAFIDACILKCESKGSMRDSRMKHIRQAAAKHCLKADFLKRHKAELIEELIAKDIGTKQYKINYYLNNRFYNELKLAMKI